MGGLPSDPAWRTYARAKSAQPTLIERVAAAVASDLLPELHVPPDLLGSMLAMGIALGLGFPEWAAGALREDMWSEPDDFSILVFARELCQGFVTAFPLPDPEALPRPPGLVVPGEHEPR